MKLMLNGKEVSGMGHYVMAGDIKDATAEDRNVLSGKVYYNNNGKREGTMPNRGGMSAELAAGGSVSILEGYHNGEGVVRAQDLASQTQGTMTAETLSVGETGWVNGKQITGSLVVPEVNDWDPEEMEEEVMLDLSGYTHVGNNQKMSLTAGKTYILILSASQTNSDAWYTSSSESNIRFYCPAVGTKVYKFVAPASEQLYYDNTINGSLWVKN